MPRLGLGLGLGSLIGRPSVGGGSVAPFSPTDLPELELWLDAGEGALNVVGNNFTDETRSIELAGFPILDAYEDTDPNGILSVRDTLNNKNFYANQNTNPDFNGRFPVEVFWDEANTRWTLYYQGETNDSGEDFTSQERYGLGDTEYPWQATWPAGATVNPVATTVDTPATNDQPVRRWVNKVSGKPDLNQLTLASQPVFKSDVFGRKAVYFNGDALSSSGFSTFGQQYSYYLVATSLLGVGGAGTTQVQSAIRLGSSASSTGWRGVFGSYNLSNDFAEDCIGTMNGNQTQVGSFLSKFVNNSSAVFSARYNLSNNGEYALGRNLVTGGPIEAVLNSTTANQSTIVIGAGNLSGSTRPINSNFSEVLVYRAYHDEATALQVINYLVQKWNINTAL